jgi:hypothetical protein
VIADVETRAPSSVRSPRRTLAVDGDAHEWVRHARSTLVDEEGERFRQFHARATGEWREVAQTEFPPTVVIVRHRTCSPVAVRSTTVSHGCSSAGRYGFAVGDPIGFSAALQPLDPHLSPDEPNRGPPCGGSA